MYSFEQPLFTVFITRILLKETEPYYTFSPRPIRLIQNHSRNLKCVKSFIWNSPKLNAYNQLVLYIFIYIIYTNLHFLISRFQNIDTLVKLVELIFKPLLPTEFTSVEQLSMFRGSNEISQDCVASKLDYQENMIKVIYDVSRQISTIKKDITKLKNAEYSSEIYAIKLNRKLSYNVGRLWVLCGMCSLEVFSAMSPVDPLQKTKIRVHCSKAEVFYLLLT